MNEQKKLTPHAEGASLVESLAEAIVDNVMQSKYAPGQRLIAADLAEEFDVSRAPVREALHMLAGEGVVELIANRGARIRRLSLKECIDFLEFTEALCMLGVRRGTARINEPGNREQLTEDFAAIEGAWARRHSRDFVDALYQYHVTLNAISGNEFVAFFYRRPYMRFYTIALADLAPGGHWDQYIENYRRIHETIVSGDHQAAVRKFGEHIDWVLAFMELDNA